MLCGVCVSVGEQGVQMDKMYSSSSVARFFSLPLLIAVIEVHVCICDGVGAWTFFFFFWKCCPFESGAMLM